jgi:hypothetical protein
VAGVATEFSISASGSASVRPPCNRAPGFAWGSAVVAFALGSLVFFRLVGDRLVGDPSARYFVGLSVFPRFLSQFCCATRRYARYITRLAKSGQFRLFYRPIFSGLGIHYSPILWFRKKVSSRGNPADFIEVSALHQTLAVGVWLGT